MQARLIATEKSAAPLGSAGTYRMTGLLLLLAVSWSAAPADGQTGPPLFAVRTAEGRLLAFPAAAPLGAGYSVDDETLAASVTSVGDEQWELSLRNAGQQAFLEVWFPWEPEATAVNGDLADDIVYYPRFVGVAEKADQLEESSWWGESYPGHCFAPLVVVADERAARIVAAVNWPPERVSPVISRGRVGLRYGGLPAGQTGQYRALVAAAPGDPANGVHAWHLVLDKYKDWLRPHMEAEGLHPIEYPEAFRKAHGWLNVQLHHLARFDVAELRAVYERHRQVFPWIQCWGQMSNYQRSPLDGRADFPEPPLEPNERTGCCVDEPRMHARYRPDLPALAREITARGGLMGYYARPMSPYQRLDGPDSPDLAFLTQWIEENRRDGANVLYLDVVGVRDFGAPLAVARLFQHTFPALTLTEYVQDIYPTSALIGGSLWGLRRWHTEPGQTPADLGPELPRVTFPRFGRYLLDDRVMFLGYSNGDFMWWGPYRGHDYWTERQAFLLGAKLDAPTLFKGQRGWINPVNQAVELIVGEWERVGWWDRRPVYRDRAGISDLPDGIDVRRFEDREGTSLFVVDNWHGRSGQAFHYLGRPIIVPTQRLCIMVLPKRLESRP